MNNNGLTKQIFEIFENRKTNSNWLKQIQEDLNELQNTDEMIKSITYPKKIVKDENQWI